jgi:hypothetical protein
VDPSKASRYATQTVVFVTATVTVATTYLKVPNSFGTCLEEYLVGLQVIAAAAASGKRYNSRQ